VVTIGASGAKAVSSPNISAPPNMVVGEADGYVDLPVTLSAPSTNTVSVNYTVPGGSDCTYSTWFGGSSGTLTFTPGETTQVVRVIINNCGTAGTQWFNLNLSTATDGIIVDPSTLVGIVGDGNLVASPGLYVKNAVVDNSAGNINVPVLLGGPEGATSASTVTVKYTTTNGSAVAGTDYTSTSGTLTFGPGQTVQNITVPIIDRSGVAPSRSFGITLSSPSNAVITDGTGVVTIGASGAKAVSSPNISAPPNMVVGEADGYVDLPVSLSAPSTNTVTVNYTVPGGGDCTYSTWFEGTSGTLTFTPGETTQAVRVIINNCAASGTQSFDFNLSGAINGKVTRATSTVKVVSKITAPGAPTAVTAVAGNGSAMVSFTAPASDGGDSINKYTVTSAPGGITASGVGSPITVTGLTNGISYTFTVTATSPAKTGKASVASNAVTPT
jgi:chitinase